MTMLLFLACLVLAPAGVTWGLVRFVLARSPARSRARVLWTCVPPGAILPLLPGTLIVARSSEIYNPWLIAIMGTAVASIAVGLCVCLPVGLALTRQLGR